MIVIEVADGVVLSVRANVLREQVAVLYVDSHRPREDRRSYARDAAKPMTKQTIDEVEAFCETARWRGDGLI